MVEESELNLTHEKLVTIKNKSHANGTVSHSINVFSPPDGGTRAWLVMIGSFFCNGILFGVINSYSVLYKEFHDNLVHRNDTDASSKAALVGSLAMGTTFFISPVSGMLTDHIGIRMTTFLGGALASSGMFFSSFCVDNIVGLCITYGVMYGLGGSLAYTPSLTVLGHYFQKYLGIVNGVVTAGSSVFTIAMPYIIDKFLKSFGIVWTLRLLALIASGLMACAILFKPANRKVPKKKSYVSDIFNMKVLTNKRYIIWASVIAISLFGYFVPYVYILKFVEKNFDKDVDGKLPVLCIGVTSGLGRLLFGYIADHPKANRIYLQQIAFFSIGVLTMLLSSSSGNFTALLAISLGMGLFDGCFISVLGPIAFDICGKDGAAQAIGFLLGICSVPLTIGPYVAGKIYDSQKSYTIPFMLAGVPPTVGAIAMFLMHFIKSPPTSVEFQESNEASTRLRQSVSVKQNPHCIDATIREVENIMKTWLRNTPDREGGRLRHPKQIFCCTILMQCIFLKAGHVERVYLNSLMTFTDLQVLFLNENRE